jgi:hypothetical protein
MNRPKAAVSYIWARASGASADEQREAVAAFLGDGVVLEEFVEIDPIRKPKLAEALEYAKARKAAVVFGEIGRLAREPRFITRLIEQRVPIGFADHPDTNITMLQYHAVVAHRLARSRVSKSAVAAGKARAVQNKADALVRLAPVRDRLARLRAEGLSIRRIAETLNAEGVASPGGGKWHAANVHKALERLHSL